MSKRMAMAAVVVSLGLGLIAGTTNADVITFVSETNYNTAFSTFDLSAIGTSDWEFLTNVAAASPRKAGVTELLHNRTGDPYGGGYTTTTSGAATMEWNDADGGGPGMAGSSTQYSNSTNENAGLFVFTAEAAPATRTLTVWVACWNGGNNSPFWKRELYAYLGTQASPAATFYYDVSYTDAGASASPWHQIVIEYSSATSSPLTVEWGYVNEDSSPGPLGSSPTDDTYYGRTYVEAVALSEAEAPPVPEPATLLLVGTGVLGVFGYARRRMIK